MKEISQNTQKVSRRDFLAGSALFAGAVGAGALAGCSGPATESNSGGGIARIEWNEETDVVVVGFGGSGATAAIGASDAGANVILLEKAPEKDAGGNTSVSGGVMLFPTKDVKDMACEFLRYQMPEIIIADGEINGFVDELSEQAEWLEAHGATVSISGDAMPSGALYGSLPTAAGMNRISYVGGNGAGLFAFLKEATESSAGVQIRYETPAKKLIFDPQTKEVFGVIAQGPDGTELNIKARRAVVLTCGGFENDPYFKNTYYAPEVPIYPCGTPYNTGDGLKMISELGVKTRGFASIEWACHCCKPASEEIGVAIAHTISGGETWGNAIMVNDQGKRFVNETQPVASAMPGTRRPLHEKSQLPELAFDMDTIRYTNLPMFMICGETKIEKGPIFSAASKDTGNHWAHLKDWYTWSDDNQAEISKGWITKADSLSELADKLGIDAAGLEATMATYDSSCETGVDPEFGRTELLSPIGSGPYYGCELGLGVINTQGGPARDAEHHVLDWNDKPIPRLYSAGEFGSIYVYLYQGGGNVSETIGGRVAGEMAALETPWD